jgi:tetratricopeptide (TPR) repeat protein/transcriptional regulator with XRE-family HTH domain
VPRPLKPVNPYASWAALFGATVRKLRLALGVSPVVSQEELGKRIGFDGSTVGAVERGILRPDRKFVEGCERELAAGGMLQAMRPFLDAEWAECERRGVPGPMAGAQLTPELVPNSLDPPEVRGLEVAGEWAVEALELGRRVAASDIGAGTLESIDRAVDRFCRDYPSTPPDLLAAKVQRHLRYVRRLLDGRKTLAQHRQLLVAGGWLAVLLACLHFDLGDREAAEATRDIGFQLGVEAGHEELVTWSYELLAWFALVDGRYHETVTLAQTGLELAPSTSAGVQLAVQQAKAWSRLGDRREAEVAMRRAAGALARLPVPFNPEHHFVFDPPKLSFYAATCYTWLGELDRAEEHAQDVVSQCLATPGLVRWPVRLAENRVDLGLIAVRRGQPDQAADLGRQALDSERKSGSTLGRVAELDMVLMTNYAEIPETRDLHERYLVARRSLTEGTQP